MNHYDPAALKSMVTEVLSASPDDFHLLAHFAQLINDCTSFFVGALVAGDGEMSDTLRLHLKVFDNSGCTKVLPY